MLKTAKWVVAILLLVVVGLAGCALYTAWSGHASGSMWGTDVRVWANLALPLFSFAGALAIVLGFLVQQEQINEQQKQFNQRRFEATFFNLLEIHHKLLEKIEHRDVMGQDAFDGIFTDLVRQWRDNNWNNRTGDERIDGIRQFVANRRIQVYRDVGGALRPFLDNVVRIVELTDDMVAYIQA